MTKVLFPSPSNISNPSHATLQILRLAFQKHIQGWNPDAKKTENNGWHILVQKWLKIHDAKIHEPKKSKQCITKWQQSAKADSLRRVY